MKRAIIPQMLLLLFLTLFTVSGISAFNSREKRDYIPDFPGFDWLRSFFPIEDGGFSFTLNIPDFEANNRQVLRNIQGVLQNIQDTLENDSRDYPSDADGTVSDVFYVDGVKCNVKKSVKRSGDGGAFAYASGYSCVPS
ncbi:uncharacterized protein LOC106475669 [Limulus polyphemus]|uniref:Uncharacterized protein LOC106475669 n=1 Tax=Limulus polyphemus TaxID=6850 RepID=A0ABM1BZX7_LIMPO|nr:uncharacterized protein LOC106475669 [Limulus polyphemus]XP_022235433.1 uncharacterized protein LOC106475669 [Limulus polyphemus]